MWQTQKGLIGLWEYNSDLFEKASETDEDFESAWGELVEQIETVVVSGSHLNMMSPPHVQSLVQHGGSKSTIILTQMSCTRAIKKW